MKRIGQVRLHSKEIKIEMNHRVKVTTLILALIISSSALATVGPSSVPASPVADGNAVFAAKCAVCHGKDGRGTPNWRAKGQPDFTDSNWQKSKTDAVLFASTKNGKGKFMPAFGGKLSDDDITAVVARVRAFGKK
jgi:cbb3-type cytochrome c oxidase subunit III